MAMNGCATVTLQSNMMLTYIILNFYCLREASSVKCVKMALYCTLKKEYTVHICKNYGY